MNRMNCHDVLPMLDELADGSLGAADRRDIDVHLARCAGCRAELEDLERLVRQARELPGEIEPGRDLWPGVRAAIEQRRVVTARFWSSPGGPGRRVWLAAAAAAVLVLSVSVAYMIGRGHAPARHADIVRPAPSVATAASFGFDTDLASVTTELRERLNARRDELSPETWSVVTENLSVIDRAIERIESALAENPDDGRLSRQLAVAYRRQIDLLQRATTLPAEVEPA